MHGHESELERNIPVEAPCYRQAFGDGDPENTGVWFGEAAGLISAIEPASIIIERMAAEAADTLIGHAGATMEASPRGSQVQGRDALRQGRVSVGP